MANTRCVCGWKIFLMLTCSLCSVNSQAAVLRVGISLDPSVPGQYNDIEAAVSAASDYDTIVIGSGTYALSRNLNISRTDLVMRGAGKGLTIVSGAIFLGNRNVLSDMTVTGVINTSNGSNSKILNVQLSESGLTISKPGYYVENSEFGGGLHLNNNSVYSASNATIAGNTFSGYVTSSNYNDTTDFSADVTIVGNTFHILEQLPAANSVYPNFGAVFSGKFSNNLVIRANETTADQVPPLLFSCSPRIAVSNNTFTSPPSDPLPVSQLICEYWENNIFEYPGVATIDEHGNVVGEVNYVDEANGNYHLQSGEIGVDGGVGLDTDGSQANSGVFGGDGASVWEDTPVVAGKPYVGPVLVQPTPVAPGEPIRIQFNAYSN